MRWWIRWFPPDRSVLEMERNTVQSGRCKSKSSSLERRHQELHLASLPEDFPEPREWSRDPVRARKLPEGVIARKNRRGAGDLLIALFDQLLENLRASRRLESICAACCRLVCLTRR